MPKFCINCRITLDTFGGQDLGFSKIHVKFRCVLHGESLNELCFVSHQF